MMTVKSILIAIMMVFLTINIAVHGEDNPTVIRIKYQMEDMVAHCTGVLKNLGLTGTKSNDENKCSEVTFPEFGFIRPYHNFLMFVSKNINDSQKPENANYVDFYCRYIYPLLEIGYNGLLTMDKVYNPEKIFHIIDREVENASNDYKEFINPIRSISSIDKKALIQLFKYASEHLSKFGKTNSENNQ